MQNNFSFLSIFSPSDPVAFFNINNAGRGKYHFLDNHYWEIPFMERNKKIAR